MINQSALRRSVATVFATALFFVQQAAVACEGCKQSVGMGDGAGGSRVVNATGVAFGMSIIGALLLVSTILAGLIYMMYRNCQIIAARQNALLAEEDAALGGGAMPLPSRA